MKLTRHNGRSGKHGTYNPKHNDRTFDVSNSEHIDEERAKHNVYWDCFNGYRTFAEKQVQSELADTFEEVEEQKNAFDLDRLINRRRRPGLNEACTMYEVTVPDDALTEEDEDILNYDDIDDPDAFA